MLNYTIGNFYGILLTFGILIFLSLIAFKGIFMITDQFLGRKNAFYHYHYHYKDRSSHNL
jgi:hypothetical protein